MEKQEEIWKNVLGYEGLYQISNHGAIKSLEREVFHPKGNLNLKEKILSPIVANNGYRINTLCSYGINKMYLVHRLVSEAFIPNPENKKQVNHINGIKNDNRVENLEWCTREENTVHAVNNSLYQVGSKHHGSKLTEEQVIEIRLSNLTNKQLSLIYEVDSSNISAIKRNKTWKHV